MSFDFKRFNQTVSHAQAARTPVLLRGRHGIGKSQVVYQYAKRVGLPVIERRASQMTEGDLIGLPRKAENEHGESITAFAPPDWLHESCRRPVVLFLDEVDRAVMEVRQSIFQLTDSRAIYGHRLHDDTLIFGAVNSGAHGAQYTVGDMDAAELDRWTVYDIEPSFQDWLNWASEKGEDGNFRIAEPIREFLSENTSALEHNGELEPNKVYPSRRSWERLHNALSCAGVLNDLRSNTDVVAGLSEAILGMEVSVQFTEFCRSLTREMSPQDILSGNWKAADLPKHIEGHAKLRERFIAEKVFEDVLDDQQMEQVVKYWYAAPAEIALQLGLDFFAEKKDGADIQSFSRQLITLSEKESPGNGYGIRLTRLKGFGGEEDEDPEEEKEEDEKDSSSSNGKRSVTCSVCGKTGHNAQTCPEKESN